MFIINVFLNVMMQTLNLRFFHSWRRQRIYKTAKWTTLQVGGLGAAAPLASSRMGTVSNERQVGWVLHLATECGQCRMDDKCVVWMPPLATECGQCQMDDTRVVWLSGFAAMVPTFLLASPEVCKHSAPGKL